MSKQKIVKNRPQNWLLCVNFTAKNHECAVRSSCKMSEKIPIRSIRGKLNNL